MPKKQKQIEVEDKAIYAINDYLKSIGWSCLVGGFYGITETSSKYKFRLIFDFVGKKKKDAIT